MRNGWVLPGVILLLITFLLLYIPFPDTQNVSVTSANSIIHYCPTVLPGSSSSSAPSSANCLSGDAEVALSWTGGNSTTWLEVVPCKVVTCKDINLTYSPVPTRSTSWDAVGRGASGRISLWMAMNISFLLITNSSSGVNVALNWNVMPEYHDVWGFLGLIGMMLVTVGILLPSEPRRERRRPEPQPQEQEAEAPYEGPPTEPEESSAVPSPPNPPGYGSER